MTTQPTTPEWLVTLDAVFRISLRSSKYDNQDAIKRTSPFTTLDKSRFLFQFSNDRIAIFQRKI